MSDTEQKNAVQDAREAELIPAPAAAPAVQPKKPLLSSAKHIIDRTLAPLKGADTAKMIEEFTSEVSLVAEGLSEDQERISRLIDNVAAQQTTFENDVESRLDDVKSDLKANEKRFKELESKLSKVEKLVQEKKIKKVEGWTGFVRALTWLVGVAAVAWIVVTILNKVM
ncbi:MAG: hypothetical protein CW338_11985 [Clostridiales bacterium]|jgi:hypothetical protein|nr:hypothetical protein [Clostridiales bacterium]